MNKLKKIINYFSKTELFLWVSGVLFIIFSFFLFKNDSFLTLVASLVGVTSLIFNAKGNPFGQFLMIVFSVLYGIISYSFAYYGEMLTYLGMTAPMALFALVSWLMHPYEGNKAEVEINSLKLKEVIFMLVFSAVVTFAFYFVLKYFNTANLVLSTVSVTTSFVAVYLTFRRSPYFAFGYALNDIVLIGLWTLASIENSVYISVVICFVMFFINDIYGFLNWQKMKKRQKKC